MSEPNEQPTPDEAVQEHEERFSYTDARDEQAELEGLVEEKGDFQAGVEAQRRGEEPDEEQLNEPIT